MNRENGALRNAMDTVFYRDGTIGNAFSNGYENPLYPSSPRRYRTGNLMDNHGNVMTGYVPSSLLAGRLWNKNRRIVVGRIIDLIEDGFEHDKLGAVADLGYIGCRTALLLNSEGERNGTYAISFMSIKTESGEDWVSGMLDAWYSDPISNGCDLLLHVPNRNNQVMP